MSEPDNKYTRFEQQIRNLFSGWSSAFKKADFESDWQNTREKYENLSMHERFSRHEARYSGEEMTSDWAAVRNRMKKAASANPKPAGTGNISLLRAGLIVAIAAISGYFLLQYFDTDTGSPVVEELLRTPDVTEIPGNKESGIDKPATPGKDETANEYHPGNELFFDDITEIISVPDPETDEISNRISEQDEPTQAGSARDKYISQAEIPNEETYDESKSPVYNRSSAVLPPGGVPGSGPVQDETGTSGGGGSRTGSIYMPDDSIYCNYTDAGAAQKTGSNFREPGTYIIHEPVKRNGFSDTVERRLIVSKPVKAAFETDNTQLPVVNFIQNSENATRFYWDFGDNNQTRMTEPSHTYHDTGQYRVILIAENEHECRDTAAKTIFVYPEPSKYIPNTFSPDGSGVNEHFFVQMEGEEFFNIRIFDRNNSIVFRSNDKTEYWDGTYQGSNKNCPPGTYYYILEFRWMGAEETETRRGTIYLNR